MGSKKLDPRDGGAPQGREIEMTIYFDNASTTAIDKRVWKKMEAFQFEEGYGNASSVHALGVRASTAIEQVRQKVAEKAHSRAQDIFFLSGGSEANNWVVQSLLQEAKKVGRPFHWLTTETEHSSLSKLVPWVQSAGGQVSLIPVDSKGHLSQEFLEGVLKKHERIFFLFLMPIVKPALYNL